MQENPYSRFNPRSEHQRDLSRQVTEALLPRKTSYGVRRPSVPQTDTGRQDEYSKALERTMVKELGKMTP